VTVSQNLRSPRAPGADVVLVANEVGGRGGMEQQLERLVVDLLDAGRTVTVIARACAIARSDGLRFVRVRCPGRPFVVAFPLFFIVGTWLVRRNPGRVVHTTGAIVSNRADLSTVHYCHVGAARRLSSPRARRDTSLYRANAKLAAWMARAGERWCYRPTRTRRLCAVSAGLARELTQCFPRVKGTVSVVANGVDVDLYRPDAGARADIRNHLGIAADSPTALFAGGDWDRKGLRHVVAALARSPSWHLVIAGEGDWAKLMDDTASVGCAQRVHYLGSVQQMAPVYAACDAFVLPTAYETFSLVTYEAAASGLPLLVTKVSGIEDVVAHGVNGWFINRDGSSIARRLADLDSAGSLRQDMSRAARAAAAAFTWQAMTDGYRELYAELGLPVSGVPLGRRSSGEA
jgi:glycosyltransferase involved in cell wall biosynthesis